MSDGMVAQGITVKFNADLTGLQSGVSDVKSSLGGITSVASGVGSGISSIFGGVVSGAFGIAGQAVGFLKNQLSDSISVAEVHQGIMAQTAQVVKSTGDASGMTASAIADLGMSLSHVTAFSDDTIQSGENLLMTFTGIGKDVFPATTKTMLDMAQAMGGDTKGAALMLGKALNDPATGLTALTRVGVTFSTQEKEQIKTMMAHNDVVGAQKVMLKELQTEFGGSAEAAGKTFAGSLQILKNDMMDVKQQIGGALLPVLQSFTGFVTSTGMPILEGFGNWFSNTAGPALKGFSDNIGKAFNSLPMQVFLSSVQALGSQLGNLFNIAVSVSQIILGQFGGSFGGAGKQIKDLASGALFTLDDILIQVGYKIHDFANFLNQMDFGEKIDAVKQFGTSLSNSFGPPLKEVASILGGQFKTDLAWLGTTFAQIGGWVQSSLMPALAALVPPFMSIATTVATNLLPAFATLYASGHQLVEAILTPLINVLEQILPPAISFAGMLAGGLATGFQIVAPLIKGLADGISGLVNFFTKTELGGDLVKATLIALAIPVGILVIAFTALAVQAVAGFIMSIPTMVAGFLAGAAGAWSMAAGVIAATWPILAIIAVIALVILAIQHWGDIVNWLKGAWGAISTFFVGLWNGIASFFVSMWAGIVGHAKQGGSAFSSWWSGIWNGILSALKVAWNAIVNAVKVGAQFILMWVLGPFIAIGALFVWLYGHNTYVKQLVDAIVNFFKGCFTWLQGAWTATVTWLTGLWNGIVGIAKTAWNAVSKTITDVVNTVVGWLKAAWDTEIRGLTNIWNAVSGIATTAWNAVSKAINDAFSAAIGFVSSIWDSISSFFVNAWNNYISKPLTAAWNNVSNVFSSAWNNYIVKPLTDLWNSISKWFTDLGTHATDSGKNFIKMLVDGITSGSGAIWDAVTGIANTIWKALGFHSPAKAGPGADADKWMPNLVNMLSSNLTAGVPKMQAAVNAVAQPLAALSPTNKTSGANADKWVSDFIAKISNDLTAGTSKIQTAVTKLSASLNGNANYASLAGSKAIQAGSSAQPVIVQVQPNDVYLDNAKVTDIVATRMASMIRMKGNIRKA